MKLSYEAFQDVKKLLVSYREKEKKERKKAIDVLSYLTQYLNMKPISLCNR